MFKKLLVLIVMFYAAACFAAVEINKATAAELDSIKGIGPAMSSKILDERKKGNFKDWSDFISRVKGVADASATKFSAEGLTVNGAAYKAAATATAAAATPASSAKAAAPASAAKADAAPAAKPAASAAKK